MSELQSKRGLRGSGRGNGNRTETRRAEASELAPPVAPETATAAVALDTATVAEPIAESPPAAAEPSPAPAASVEDPWADAWAAFAESQSALTRGFETIATEVTGLTRSGIAAASEAATALLGAKTFAEAIEINAGLARRSFDAMIGGTAKLSEIGVKAATDASRPILNRLGEGWKNLGAG